MRSVWVGFVLCAVLAMACSAAAQRAAKPSLIVILLPGTSLDDWRKSDAPHLHELVREGALAVMNMRTARTGSDKARETPQSALLTLGSGARAAGDAGLCAFLPPNEKVLGDGTTASQLYQRRMGSVPPAGAWVNARWPELLAANTGRGYDINLGSLADGLAKSGVDVRAGGANALALASDGQGTVRAIDTLALPTMRPSCVVWDAGPNIKAADAVVGDAMALESKTGGRVLVLSPFASDNDYARGLRLTPVALWGAGIGGPGVLYSRSTRRAGLIADTDFAPSVASYFGATLPGLPFGAAWSVAGSADALGQVEALQAQAYRQARGMRVLPVFAVVLGLYVVAASLFLYRGRGGAALGLFPAVSLAALLLSGSAGEWAAWLVGLGAVAALLTYLAGTARAVTVLCALIVGVLALDLLTGNHGMRQSLLGYSAVEGARYYGIGNEAMGVLVGAALCLAWRLWPAAKQRWMRGAIGAALVCLIGLLALPMFGAKAGSVFVAVPSFGVLLWTLSGRRLGRSAAWVLAGSALVLMATIVLLDRHAGGGQSHVGQAAARIAQGGASQAWDIVTRKLGVELHLLGHSAWAVALWGAGAGLILTAKARRGGEHLPGPFLPALLRAAAVAGATSLAFNDAGTVACVLCLAIVWSMTISE